MRSVLFLIVAAACTGSGATGPGSASSSPLVAATITTKGGLAPTPGPGSTCTLTDEAYAYDGASRVATWKRCEEQGNTLVFTYVTGRAQLSADPAKQLEAALAGLQTGSPCGSDVHDQIAITWTTGNAMFDECAQGVTAVFDVLDRLQ
jgi:hypothetical protein